jgi:hypothetical protein
VQNVVIDGVYLPAGLSAKEDKVIGKAANAPGIQEHYIRSLLITGYLNHPAG